MFEKERVSDLILFDFWQKKHIGIKTTENDFSLSTNDEYFLSLSLVSNPFLTLLFSLSQ